MEQNKEKLTKPTSEKLFLADNDYIICRGCGDFATLLLTHWISRGSAFRHYYFPAYERHL